MFIVKEIRTSLGNSMVLCMEMWMPLNHTVQKCSVSANEYGVNLHGSHSLQTKKARRDIVFASLLPMFMLTAGMTLLRCQGFF